MAFRDFSFPEVQQVFGLNLAEIDLFSGVPCPLGAGGVRGADAGGHRVGPGDQHRKSAFGVYHRCAAIGASHHAESIFLLGVFFSSEA